MTAVNAVTDRAVGFLQVLCCLTLTRQKLAARTPSLLAAMGRGPLG